VKRRANGEGSVYQRKDGRWEARISFPDGRRKAVYAKTQREVLEKKTALLGQRAKGVAVASERQTFGEYLGSSLESTRPRVRPTTHRRYELFVKVHVTPAIARIPLVKVGPQHLERLYAERLAAGAAPRSVRHLHALLHNALKQADRWGLVPRNVATLARPPNAPRHEISTLTAEQVRTLLAAAEGDRLEALYVLAISTGMRQGELLALRWSDVDLDRGAVQIRRSVAYTKQGFVFLPPKTGRSRRQVLLTQAAIAALRRHRTRQLAERLAAAGGWEDLDLVFANELGRPIEATNLGHRSWRRLLERAGLPRIRFHDLRHTAATLILSGGVHPKIASEMLGHSSVAFTMDTYAHVTPTMQREAVAELDAVMGGRP
jgi:integrase